MTLEQLIDALERTGHGAGLISDDAGHWTVSTSAFQNVPTNPPQDTFTSFLVKATDWKPTIREALQAYYDAYVAYNESDDNLM